MQRVVLERGLPVIKHALVVIAIVAGLVTAAKPAHAYPQFQLARDATCSGCHVNPAGGGLLNENGMAAAEAMSQFGDPPEFMYNKIPLPSWLELGGELRNIAGYFKSPQDYLALFPMQADVYAAATFKAFQIHVTVGYRPPEYGNEAATYVWSREHYLQWQSDAGSNEGLFIRAGRFMPVFGLRLAEHVDYTRQYGGTPLYGETYGAAVEYVKEGYEAHLTGFVHDPLIDPVNHDNGAAAYVEWRPTKHAAIGAEGLVGVSKDEKTYRGGLTGKYYFASPDVLVQAEVQLANHVLDAGGAPTTLVGYLLASHWFSSSIMLDIGLGHYDEDIRVRNLERDCIDLNLHWFMLSHLELILNNRVELFAFGRTNGNPTEPSGGPTGGWSLLQLHYRL